MTAVESLPAAIPLPSDLRLGQGTAVEMSRAVAEVHAAMYAARQFPRDEADAIRTMEASCGQPYMAEKAFYRLPRAGGAVTGVTIHFARELARCWGHLQYGITEMRRDDDHRQSEMQAWAWDVQSGTRLSNTFIVPHARDKKDKRTGKAMPEDLVSLQDIYESNANHGARRVRECIIGILPTWYVEQAKELCSQTNTPSSDTELAEKVNKAVAWFAPHGITPARLEQKIGRPRAQWTGRDTALLGTIYRSLGRGEVTLEQEFPAELVTVAEIVKNEPAEFDELDAGQWLAALHARAENILYEHGCSPQAQYLILSALVGRDVATYRSLSSIEAETVLQKLGEITDHEDATHRLDQIATHELERRAATP